MFTHVSVCVCVSFWWSVRWLLPPPPQSSVVDAFIVFDIIGVRIIGTHIIVVHVIARFTPRW